jgi:predicted secreted protein
MPCLMKLSHALSLVFVLGLSSLAGCAAETDSEADVEVDADEAEVRAGRSVAVTEADAGKTIAVQVGQKIVVRLPSNASTGYSWRVTRVDRTLGQPDIRVSASRSGQVGSGGTTRLTWSTSGPLNMVGEHEVELTYVRPFDLAHPAKKLVFTFDVRAAVAACEVGGCSGQLCIVKGSGGISTCEYRPEYACYKKPGVKCEAQTNGQCGWTLPQAAKTCLGQ